MRADRQKLTVRLSRENVEFAKQYAAVHGTTVTVMIERFLGSLRPRDLRALHEDVIKISGIVPAHIDLAAEARAAAAGAGRAPSRRPDPSLRSG